MRGQELVSGWFDAACEQQYIIADQFGLEIKCLNARRCLFFCFTFQKKLIICHYIGPDAGPDTTLNSRDFDFGKQHQKACYHVVHAVVVVLVCLFVYVILCGCLVVCWFVCLLILFLFVNFFFFFIVSSECFFFYSYFSFSWFVFLQLLNCLFDFSSSISFFWFIHLNFVLYNFLVCFFVCSFLFVNKQTNKYMKEQPKRQTN